MLKNWCDAKHLNPEDLIFCFSVSWSFRDMDQHPTGKLFHMNMCMRVLLHVYKHEQVYITHTHTRWIQVQKYTARRLFSFYVQMSRLESNEKAPQGQRACISTVCHFLLEQKEQGGQNSTKKKKGTRVWGLVVGS